MAFFGSLSYRATVYGDYRNKSWMNGGATKVLQAVQKELSIKLTNYHSKESIFIMHLLEVEWILLVCRQWWATVSYPQLSGISD